MTKNRKIAVLICLSLVILSVLIINGNRNKKDELDIEIEKSLGDLNKSIDGLKSSVTNMEKDRAFHNKDEKMIVDFENLNESR